MVNQRLQADKHIMQVQREWLFVSALLCFLGAVAGMIGIGLLPRFTFTLAMGLLGMLIIISYPMIGVALLLFSLYFPVFPLITIGSIEFSSSTLLVVGLTIGVIRIRSTHAGKFFLLGWQKAVLIALGGMFLITSLFSNSFSATLSYVPNLVIYLLIMLAVMMFLDNSEKLYTIVKLSLVFAFFMSFWQDILEPIRLFFGVPSLGGINGMVFAFHPSVALSLVLMVTPAGQVLSRNWRFFTCLVLVSLVWHGVYFETRAAWLVWAIIAILLILRLPLRSWARFALTLLALIIMVDVLLSGVILRNLDQTQSTLAAVLGKQQSQMSSDDRIRLTAQEAGLRMFYERPLLGWGPNTFQFLKPNFVDVGGKGAENTGAFNSWLALLAEMGIVGVAIGASACFIPFFSLFMAIGKFKDNNLRVYWLAYGCALGAVALAIHALFISRMFSFFWFYVGLAISAAGMVNRYAEPREVYPTVDRPININSLFNRQ